MFNPQDIIDLLAANVRQTRNPFGVPASKFNTWWKDAGGFTRRPGDALLFTGLMYQAIPYIEATTRYLERLEGSSWAGYLRYSRFLPASLRGRGLAALTSAAGKKKFNGILHTICRLLKKSGAGFFYHPEMDFYSGILLYDLGDQDGFIKHAQFVDKTLKLHGVSKIITVDPHTTYALKELYPKYTGATFEVQPYFSQLQFQAPAAGNGKPPVVLHDPCLYGRYLQLSEGPRRVLKNLNLEYVDVRNCGEFTSCCGGPAESVSPALNREILARRAGELKAAAAPVVTFCPICLANLLKAGLPVEDLASLVGRHMA
ncbi:MAG: (Fe-S)-binding protein [Syntrophales bacterium]|nr:(Fe-S)-binding protein [Syntrophales bacterium]MDD5642254.1 (Fe-S)-binding protein [Syntrophales bacterium]